jgi:hypothetical protein
MWCDYNVYAGISKDKILFMQFLITIQWLLSEVNINGHKPTLQSGLVQIYELSFAINFIIDEILQFSICKIVQPYNVTKVCTTFDAGYVCRSVIL